MTNSITGYCSHCTKPGIRGYTADGYGIGYCSSAAQVLCPVHDEIPSRESAAKLEPRMPCMVANQVLTEPEGPFPPENTCASQGSPNIQSPVKSANLGLAWQILGSSSNLVCHHFAVTGCDVQRMTLAPCVLRFVKGICQVARDKKLLKPSARLTWLFAVHRCFICQLVNCVSCYLRLLRDIITRGVCLPFGDWKE